MLNLLGLYEKALPKSMSWVEKLLTAKQLGFDFVEISVDESEERLSRLDWSMQQRAELSKIIESVQVPILSMCFSGHRKYPLGSRDPLVRQTAVAAKSTKSIRRKSYQATLFYWKQAVPCRLICG